MSTEAVDPVRDAGALLAAATAPRPARSRRDFAYEKPPGTLRVLALGDSQTQGYEVRQEATFSAVLKQFLETHRVKAQVLNAGVSGFSTAEEFAYLVSEGFNRASTSGR